MRTRHQPGRRTPGTRHGVAPRLPLLLALLFGALAASAHTAPDHLPGGTGPLPGFRSPAEDTLITFRTTGAASSVGLALYNNAFLGNNMASRDPSFEYPVGSDEEHMVRAGVWIGGLFSRSGEIGDADTLVTTATVDGYYGGSDEATDSEFYPASSEIIQRSLLREGDLGRFYDPGAKSYHDLICEYIDDHNHASQLHEPLHLRVVQEALCFDFEPFDALVILNFYVINDHPTNPIYDLYVGMYGELASGWKEGYDEWPPSGWFEKKNIAYDDSLRLVTERHFQLDGGRCPSWGGYVLLGTRPDSIANKTVSFNWWNWDPGGNQPGTPNTDAERYLTMSNGAEDGTGGVEAPNNDPVTMLSVGPLGTASFIGEDGLEHWLFESGDTITVSFAFVGGRPSPETDPPRDAEEDIAFNAGWAQTAFNLNFSIPLPPPSPKLLVDAGHSRTTLWWTDAPLRFLDPKTHTEDFEGFRIYVSEEGKSVGFDRIREFDLVDTLFYDTGLGEIEASEPRIEIAGQDTTQFVYRYDLEGLRDGFKYWVSVTSFDTGTPEIESLESGIPQNRAFLIPGLERDESPGRKVIVFPNPYRGDAAWDEALARDRYLWFAGLPPRCMIRIYNLAGDHIRTIDFDGETYGATDVRGIYDPDDVWNPAADIPVLSGGMAAWDLTTRQDQAVASGLYFFSVENLATGEVERGKFLILK